jgi:hypothetical protein
MAKSWNSFNEFRTLSGELATSDGPHFERQIIPLLRIIWPDLVVTPSRRFFDRKGIDHLVWEDTEILPLVVQCKGFQVQEHEIGISQVQQCLESIASFKHSNCKAKTYLLIHNRTGQNEDLRKSVTSALVELVTDSCVDQAHLWDRQMLLNNVFNAMLIRIEEYLSCSSSRYSSELLGTLPYQPILETPLQISTLHTDQYRMVAASGHQTLLSDPAIEIFKFDSCNMTLLIGGAGYGKTTSVLRSLEQTDKSVFYVAASTISSEITGSKQLLAACIRVDELFGDVTEEDLLVHQAVARPIIEYLLKNEKHPVVLILDALDESLYFSRRGGIQTLFNQLRDVKVPIILTARSEFWALRQSDFHVPFGITATARTHTRNNVIKLIELFPWNDAQIVELAMRFRESLDDHEAKERITGFIELVNNGTYHEMYGDIPRRPLFLKLILDTVAVQEVKKIGIARLFYDWTYRKISRDINEPMRWGGLGREPILNENETADETITLSFIAMMNAAAQMTETLIDELVLLPDCVLNDIVSDDERLSGISGTTGLFLNSLLVPAPKFPHKQLKVCFCHRAFQEFFLALHIHENPDVFDGVKLPEAIEDFLLSIRGEEIVSN